MNLQAIFDFILIKILGVGYDLIDVIILLFIIYMLFVTFRKGGRK